MMQKANKIQKNPGTKKQTAKRLRKYMPLYLLSLPGFIYLIINNYLPMGGLVLAFKKYSFAKGIVDSPWNGLQNFTFLFGSKWAKIMFRNTICYNLAFLILGTAFAIFVAILLSVIGRKLVKQAYQTLILIPHLVSTVLIGYLVFAFLSEKNGFVNNGILAPLGMDPVSWYTKAGYWPVILVLVQLWRSFGFQSIVYFATIIGFDKAYYEAAVMDGASVWQQITRITLPLLKPTVIILTIMALGRMFASDFGLFYQVPQNSGMLYSTTTTIDTFVYRTLMQDHDVGRSLAAGFLQSILGFIVVMITNMIVRKVDKESALF
ncbi:ABC transporter permease subunit [uncultured Acetatifactor sp.]|jgi:putative aldouronate transport system permease protein|uniref:ABC transporter permease n=1 Tax=uncultured Acetatifactor sp. TaxID=1671927 RepID=UPI002ED4ADF9